MDSPRIQSNLSFDLTYEELKRGFAQVNHCPGKCFDLTYEELKLVDLEQVITSLWTTF